MLHILLRESKRHNVLPLLLKLSLAKGIVRIIGGIVRRICNTADKTSVDSSDTKRVCKNCESNGQGEK